MQPDELEFYARFVRRHGGAFLPDPLGVIVDGEPSECCYRLYFPDAVKKLPNDPDDPQMQETYRLLYPDGTSLTWYRRLILDGVPLSNTLLVPVEDGDWPLFDQNALDRDLARTRQPGESETDGGMPRISHRGGGQANVPQPVTSETGVS